MDEVLRSLRTSGATMATGWFRASMVVEPANDGPVTLVVAVDP